MLDPREIAQQHIEQAAQCLDLADAEDRVVFRQRLADGMGMTRRSFVVEMARVRDNTLPLNASRAQAVRSIANTHIAAVA
jgi:sulfur relay (sulfurtransferase) DsrF/TusC family protein